MAFFALPTLAKAEKPIGGTEYDLAVVMMFLCPSNVFAGPLEKVFTQGRVIRQACGASERFSRFAVPIQQLEQMPARGPIRLVIHHAVGGNFLKRGKSRLPGLRECNGSPDQ